MVKCVRLERKKAEAERKILAARGLLDSDYVPARDGKYVYFALKSGAAGDAGKAGSGRGADSAKLATVEKKLLKRAEHGRPFSEELKGKLTEEERAELITSFDIVGDIATVEIPSALVKKERMIAEAIMKMHHNIKVVAKKTGGTSGEFRIRPVKVIGGENRTATVYRESGCEFELDINKTYFSPRLGTERARIAALVKPGENVLVPFAGVGPFAIVTARKVPDAEVMGIELNPDATEYFRKNIIRNRCINVSVLQGDVAKLLPDRFEGWADRIAMPLPKDASAFLPNAIMSLKDGGTLHYYAFGNMEKPYAAAEKQVKDACRKLGRKATVVFRRVARPYSKTTEQVVLDVKVERRKKAGKKL